MLLTSCCPAYNTPGPCCRSVTGILRKNIHSCFCPFICAAAWSSAHIILLLQWLSAGTCFNFSVLPVGHQAFKLEKAQEDLITIFQYLKDGYKENGSSVFSSSYLEKAKRNGTKRGFMLIKEFFFYSDNNNHCNKLLRGIVEALSLVVFKTGLDRMLDNLIWAPCLMEYWTR